MVKQKNKNLQTIVIVVAVLIAAVFISQNLQIINNIPGGAGSSGGSGSGDTYGGDNYYYTNPPPASSDSLAPTSLTVVIDDTSLTMGDDCRGQVISNGYKYPITVHAKLLGTGEEQSFGALLSDYGDFYHSQPLNVPGYWDFWATADTVTSNMPRVTVEGVLITLPISHYSHTLGSPVTAKLYSHTHGNAQIVAINPATSSIVTLTNGVIYTTGYGEISVDFSVLSTGDWEVTVLINGLDAATYGGSTWLNVGR